MPEHESCDYPRDTAFPWYTHSLTRTRYPYVRSILLDAFRAAKANDDGDPVVTWVQIIDDPATAKAYKSARGKDGTTRAGRDEAMEIVVAAYIYTVHIRGLDRIAGFDAILAISRVSYGAGGHLYGLIGGTTFSFYG